MRNQPLELMSGLSMFRRLSPPFTPGAVSPAHEAVKAASGLVTQVNSEQDVYSPRFP